MELTPRQVEIIELVTKREPITGEQIAELLGVNRTTIRSDLSVLVMLGLIDAKPKVGYFLGANMSPAVERIKRLQTMQVKEVQGIPFIIRENVSVQDAVVSLFIENIGSLIVTNNEEELTGIVSRKDLLKVSVGNANSAAMPVSLVMTRHPNIVTVGPEDNVLIAAQKMIKHDVDGLPVVDRNEEGKPVVVGRITKTTMTKVLLELAGS